MKRLFFLAIFSALFLQNSIMARAETIYLTDAQLELHNGKALLKCKDGADRVTVRRALHGMVEIIVNGSRTTLSEAEAFGMEIRGGGGNDEIIVEDSINFGLVLKGNDGNDVIKGGRGNDKIEGGDGSDLLYGGGGNDNIDGGSGNDRIEGGPGFDSLRGSWGSDTIVDNNRIVREREVRRVSPVVVYPRPHYRYHYRSGVIVRVR